MNKKTFLVEIGTEELPPKSLRFLAESFAKNLTFELHAKCLAHREVHWFATPRRLALLVYDLSVVQPDRIIKNRGPATNISFDSHGRPTSAALRWASSCGITIDQADRMINSKGEWLIYNARITGEQTEKLLPEIVSLCLKKLPVSKQMRWGTSNFQFVRPVHTVILMLGDILIPANIFGIDSSRTISGHRFMGEKNIIINHADNYLQILSAKGKVEANYLVRKKIIQENAKAVAAKINGVVHLDKRLLEEVTALVEWPIVLIAQFEEKFLELPTDVIVHTMMDHQKYFPVYSYTGKLLPYFVFVSNIASENPQLIISGNEKVVRARLVDAAFFFKNDCQHPLEKNLPLLENVIFQKNLGSLRDKTMRLQLLSEWIAKQINSNVGHAKRAALLSKCDLLSQMVFEFSDIQGVMGMHYARLYGEPEEIARAIMEQYYPRFSGDSLPSHSVSCTLAIADKMDTLAGIFGINQYPTGDKDPFALRRSALGVLRIMIEKEIPLDLYTLSVTAVELYGQKIVDTDKTVSEMIKFVLGRLYVWYKERDYSRDTIQAVLACRPTKPLDIHARINAVRNFRNMEQATNLSLAHKRITHILLHTTDDLNQKVHDDFLKEKEEKKLAKNIDIINLHLKTLLSQGKYEDGLLSLTPLSEDINNFFNKVLINTTDTAVRINRLTLLSQLNTLFLKIADLSLLR
ncbi:Glycine--tRNA ligase beta subunit [Candidatus Erwinia haradaeae]|uniref:Glycine--tRNA ligase beta subunit n=1 Tax=Candidatus Erwinia haradaeae TaxID=1922217 RepID=A0A451DC81_9GAMM|nr:glycine--tRNA ligase subunit beta [Candidatus Erwinia haradaeae]VFP84035.1 Glycine--tRNA ligase beta subunit [Candidatus Erwinia haradaeae]